MAIKYKSGYKYQLAKSVLCKTNLRITETVKNSYITLTKNGIIMIKHGYAWDGATLAFDTKTFMRGSLVHDALYQLIREGLIEKHWRLNADKLLQKICIEDGMSRLRAWWVYYGVRIGGSKVGLKPRKILTAP